MTRLVILTALLSAIWLPSVPTAAPEAKHVSLSRAEAMLGSEPFAAAVQRYLDGQEQKIVGGMPAPAKDFPWQVSLGVSWIADPYSAHFCGGSVHDSNWIITAAHCVERTAPRDVVVTAGTHRLGSGGVRRNVKRIIVHASFNRVTMDNDLALVELMAPLPTGEAIQAIPVVSPEAETALLQNATRLRAVGWGATVEGGTKIRDLRFVEVPYVGRDECNRPLAYDGAITENMVCAGERAGGKDSCQGDSGGPLSIGSGADARLVGAVSWGSGCARTNQVGVYTRLSRYASWIASCAATPSECK